MDNKPLRLQVYLAHAGIGSRRKCEEYISQGRVKVNGQIIKEQGVKVTGDDKVTFDNRQVYPVKNFIYLVLHKPKNYICSNSDPEGRPVIFDLVKDTIGSRLFTIGRLDYLSSGLIILTNDGDFASYVAHPSSKIEKEYNVDTKKPIPVEMLDQIMKGITIEGIHYRIKRYKQYGTNSVNLILEEGKNREIRNIFTNWNIPVKRVHRVRIGKIKLQGLQPGRYRHLTEREIKSIYPKFSENKKDSTKK